MASPQVVITQANGDTPAVGGLFEGLSFFLVQRIPQRASFVDEVQKNGGRVVKHENQATYIIADHYRKDCPAGSISYKFIEDAIRAGELPDPESHLAGPPANSVREAGSVVPGKSTRTPFTSEDDRVLWQWVERCKTDGQLIKGNVIYKQLEKKNPRHTHQAWRDRYIKKLMDKPPPGVEVTVAANAPPSPPTAQDERADAAMADPTQSVPASKMESDPEYTDDDIGMLLENAHDIEEIAEDRRDEAWEAWAQSFTNHPAESWRKLWEDQVRSIYLERRAAKQGKRKRQRDGDGLDEHVDAEAGTGYDGSLERKPGSQNQKRGTPSRSQQKASYGRKRQKASDEIFGQPNSDDAPEESHQPENQVTSGELVRSTQPGKEQEEAEQPLDTSEANRAADLQFQRESLDPEAVVQDRESSQKPEIDDQTPPADSSKEAEGVALTESNLRSQQAEQKPDQHRGADLPEDDDEDDSEQQQDYVKFLESVTKQRDGGKNQELPPAEAAGDLPELPPNGAPTENDPLQITMMEDLPLSSQKEIDGALEDMIHWPESPKTSQRKETVQSLPKSMQFETQVAYPTLATEQGAAQSDDHVVSVSEEFTYPTLPRGADEAPTATKTHIEEEVRGSLPHTSSVYFEEGGSYVDVDKGNDHAGSQNVEDGDYVDLSIPEPDGGWDPRSSPTRVHNSRNVRTAPGQDHQDTASRSESDEDDAAESDVVIVQGDEVVELSSQSSSSSSSNDSIESQPRPVKTAGTQDIVAAETQLPDFNMPLPPDSDMGSDERASQPPSSPPNAASDQPNPTTDEEDLDTWINTWVHLHNLPETSVMQALKCTSMRPELAELVLMDEKAGRGFPRDVRGVWTEEEDAVLERSGDAKAHRRLEAKHSWAEMEIRWKFLAEWREGEEEEEE